MNSSPRHPYLSLMKRKNQVVPNALILDKRLSDQAVRLLAALNATDTCEEASNPSKQELAKLLQWEPQALELVMKECQEAGYIRLTKNDYSFDIEGSFRKVGGR